MRDAVVCMLLCGLLAPAGRAEEPSPEPPSEGLAALKGAWAVTRMNYRGRERKVPEGMSYVFEGDKLTRTAPARGGARGLKQTFKVKVDTRKKPHRLTLTSDAGGKEYQYIFKIEKGELFLAVGRRGETPANFDDMDARALVMKRVKGK